MPFTPDSALDLLFPEELIPQHIKNQLPPELHLRPLASTDYERGHLSVLAVLREAPDVGAEAWAAQFQAMRGEPGTYYILVIVSCETDRIVGSGGVFIERKFLRGLASAGHIEDVVVAREMQGKKLGLRIIQALTQISKDAGCYKSTLNCTETNIAFYEKCGYEKRHVEMVCFK